MVTHGPVATGIKTVVMGEAAEPTLFILFFSPLMFIS
jgi:hypothetical protein